MKRHLLLKLLLITVFVFAYDFMWLIIIKYFMFRRGFIRIQKRCVNFFNVYANDTPLTYKITVLHEENVGLCAVKQALQVGDIIIIMIYVKFC